MRKIKKRTWICILLILVLLGSLLSGCGKDSEKKTSASLRLDDFEEASLGILTGSSYDALSQDQFPEAERLYYSSISDMIISVEAGKIDGFLADSPFYTSFLWDGCNIAKVEEPIATNYTGFGFAKTEKGQALCDQITEYVLQLKSDGRLDALRTKWLESETEPSEHPDYQGLTGENGTLKVAVSVDTRPILYMKEQNVSGLEAEILTMFAEEYGYALEFYDMTFDSIIPGIVSGKYDLGASGLNITEERKESILFSEPHIVVDIVMIVKGDQQKSGFWISMGESFEKTFIRENRWKLFLEGLGVTILISVCAAAFGSLLGFGLYLLRRSRNPLLAGIARGVGKIYSRIVAGTPMVVILMILFYVIFGRSDISGIPVAIIGFLLTFGAFVYDHLIVCVENIPKGQFEAAHALGYKENKAFFRLILPQAMKLFFPSYSAEIVSLVKATAIVGYIAVSDLTRVGDIIRSNTYEAFFPLISVAVIYFLLTWVLTILLNRLRAHLDPQRRDRSKILKGVITR